jgi:hypothetical protein
MPMRVIAKKRCRAMFEPPEKGERATLNPNLSTGLNLLFSDQALRRRVGYCWSGRASVPRLIFNAKTLKLCSKIKFATQAQQTAPSRHAVECSQWVINRPQGAYELGPFIPRQRTCGDCTGISVSCLKRK